MVATTLRTFLLQTPSTITSVEVLGSWDNFTQPYPLDRDRGLGRGHWRGCHAFPNVGQKVRTVGLNMGGVYWYYYRFDGGEIQYHDPVEPSTTACPLLPGQSVNVLEVPVEEEGSRPGSPTSLNAYQWTLDPNEKYSTPKPCDPAKHAKRTSDASAMASFHNAWKKRSSQSSTPPSVGSHADAPNSRRRQSSSKAFFEGVKKRFRPSSPIVGLPGTGGLEPGLESEQKGSLFSKSKRLLKSAKAERKSMFYKHPTKSMPDQSPGEFCGDVPPLPTNAKAQAGQVRAPVNTRHGDIPDAIYVADEVLFPSSSPPGTSECPLLPSAEPAVVEGCTRQPPIAITDGHNLTVEDALATEHQGAAQQRDSGCTDAGYSRQPSHSKPTPLDLSKSSSISPDIAPSFTYTSTLSLCRLSQPSQPATPSFRNFDDDFSWIRPDSETLPPLADPKTADGAFSGDFEAPHAISTDMHTPVYNLTPAEHASALTLKRLPSKSLSFSSHAKEPLSPESRHEYVHAWNEGQGQYLMGQQQLVEEMGYLGQAII